MCALICGITWSVTAAQTPCPTGNDWVSVDGFVDGDKGDVTSQNVNLLKNTVVLVSVGGGSGSSSKYDWKSLPPATYCTGTLVSEKLVLTAAHCFDKQVIVDAWNNAGYNGEDLWPKYKGTQTPITSKELAEVSGVSFQYQSPNFPSIPDDVVEMVESKYDDYMDVTVLKLYNSHVDDHGDYRYAILDGNPIDQNEYVWDLMHPHAEYLKVDEGFLSDISQWPTAVFIEELDVEAGASGSGVLRGGLTNARGIIGIATERVCKDGKKSVMAWATPQVAAYSADLKALAYGPALDYSRMIGDAEIDSRFYLDSRGPHFASLESGFDGAYYKLEVGSPGGGISGGSDAIQYSYKRVDKTWSRTVIEARLLAREESPSHFGVMIRDNLNPTSAYVSIILQDAPIPGIQIRLRSGEGLPSNLIYDESADLGWGTWLKVVSENNGQGNMLTLMSSLDGVNYTSHMQVPIFYGNDYHMGLFAYADYGSNNTAFFDNVFVGNEYLSVQNGVIAGAPLSAQVNELSLSVNKNALSEDAFVNVKVEGINNLGVTPSSVVISDMNIMFRNITDETYRKTLFFDNDLIFSRYRVTIGKGPNNETVDIESMILGSGLRERETYEGLKTSKTFPGLNFPVPYGYASAFKLPGINGTRTFTSFVVPPGAKDVKVSTRGGEGESNLYVTYDGMVSDSANDCASEGAGTVKECALNNGAGTYNVLLEGSGYEGVMLELNYTPPVAVTYLSDLNYTEVSNGYGPSEKDQSNGGKLANDGSALTINGETWAKGIGVHSGSELVWDLSQGQYSELHVNMGVDDEVSKGTVQFQIWADNVLKYMSPIMNANANSLNVNVNVAGAKSLKLISTKAWDNKNGDHADWADAKLLRDRSGNVPSDLASGTYNIVSVKSNKCLDIRNSSRTIGASVIQFNCNGSLSQKFKVTKRNDGFYRVKNVKSGKSVDIKDHSLVSKANVIQWTSHSRTNQQFAIYPYKNDGGFVLMAKHSNQVLDVKAESLASGANVIQYPFHGGANQIWKFIPVEN